MILIVIMTVVDWIGRNVIRQRAWRSVLDNVLVPMQKGNSIAMSGGRVKAIKAMLDLERERSCWGIACLGAPATMVVRMLHFSKTLLSFCRVRSVFHSPQQLAPYRAASIVHYSGHPVTRALDTWTLL